MMAAAALVLAACSPLKTLDAITPSDSYTVQRDEAYGTLARQRADVYRPLPKAVPSGAPPVAVFFYGGNWRSGSKAQYRFVAEALAERGVLVIVPDYRLYPEVRYTEILQDSAQATAWVLGHAASWGGDPQRVYVVGHSAGAYNAAMVAMDARWLERWHRSPTQLAGFVGLAGPYNFLPIGNPDVQPVFAWPDTPADSQPLAHVSAATAPRRSLLIAPQHDRLVDPENNTAALADALRSVNAPVEVHLYKSLTHTTTVGSFAWPLRPLAPVLDEVAAFITSTDPHSAAAAR